MNTLKNLSIPIKSLAMNNWTSRLLANAGWMGLCYGNGRFVGVAQSGAPQVTYSQDGVGWSLTASINANLWNAICYNNGLYVAVASSGVGNRVMTSADAINWFARTSAADNNWNAICCGNGLYVAVASSGVGNRVMTSADAINWTARTSASDSAWNAICYGNGLFVAVGSTGKIMTSPDGFVWTARSSGITNNLFSVAYGNGVFVAGLASGIGTKKIISSKDGITWTLRESFSSVSCITFGAGFFVGITSSPNSVIYSFDGATWIQGSYLHSTNAAKAIIFGDGIFAIINSGAVDANNHIVTSMNIKSLV